MKKIYLIDANNLIYRMFFALPEFNAPNGQPVNAVFGVAKWILGSLATQKPDYVFFIKDAKGKNFRHDLYTEYKATRDKMPDDLRSQMSIMEDMITKM
jgi:DNA polymerase I